MWSVIPVVWTLPWDAGTDTPEKAGKDGGEGAQGRRSGGVTQAVI